MIYIFISACCSVGVSVLLKLFKRYNIDIFQAITWNYLVAVILTFILLKPQLNTISAGPAYLYTALGILLPALFVIIGLAVKYAGIIRTDVAQRLSLLIPVIISFAAFNETASVPKIAAIAVGIAAVVCLIPWQKQRSTQAGSGNTWVYLLVVFVGMGIIDVLFKQMALFTATTYTTSLLIVYSLAFILCLIRLCYLLWFRHVRFAAHYIAGGALLGLVNFGNILFYLKAHKALATQPSIVFSSMNIGVVALGTFVGLFVFREKLSLLNKAGIALAVVSILIVYFTAY
jgi:drug/metabolite transporter (DMT)-like permease